MMVRRTRDSICSGTTGMITSYLSKIKRGIAPSPLSVTSNIGSGLPST